MQCIAHDETGTGWVFIISSRPRWFVIFEYSFIYFPGVRNQMDENANPLELIQIAFTIFWAISMLFIACEFGEMVTHRFDRLDQKLCHCKWYLFSLKMQRIYGIAMTNTQQSPIIHGFANTQCTRGSFKRVKMEHFNKTCRLGDDFSSWNCFALIFRQYKRASPIFWCLKIWETHSERTHQGLRNRKHF